MRCNVCQIDKDELLCDACESGIGGRDISWISCTTSACRSTYRNSRVRAHMVAQRCGRNGKHDSPKSALWFYLQLQQTLVCKKKQRDVKDNKWLYIIHALTHKDVAKHSYRSFHTFFLKSLKDLFAPWFTFRTGNVATAVQCIRVKCAFATCTHFSEIKWMCNSILKDRFFFCGTQKHHFPLSTLSLLRIRWRGTPLCSGPHTMFCK